MDPRNLRGSPSAAIEKRIPSGRVRLVAMGCGSLASLLLIYAGPLFGQVPSSAPEGVSQPTVDQEVVVTTRATGSAAPIQELAPAEIQSYATDTLTQLLEALEPQTRSSRSSTPPIVLIDGRLAGPGELENLPPEAIAKVEILPEVAALKYGYGEDQRVVNIVLRQPFDAVRANAGASGATEGGGQVLMGDASILRIDPNAQGTVRGSYKASSALRDSERGIDLPDSSDVTLLPRTQDTKLTATLSSNRFGMSSSAEASFDRNSSTSLQGSTESGRLQQTTSGSIAHVAAHANGPLGSATWTANGSYDRSATRASSDTGTDAQGGFLVDRSDAVLQSGILEGSLSGPVLALPAGAAVANVKLGLYTQAFDTHFSMSGATPDRSALARVVRSGKFNVNLPLASRENGALPPVGDASASLNVTLDSVSAVGTLISFGYGLNWSPVKPLHMNFSFSDVRVAPTLQQLLSPAIVTPDTVVFDYVTDETVSVSEINGGDLGLRPTETRVSHIGLFAGPLFDGAIVTANYEHSRIANPIGQLPAITPGVENAFPARFVRDGEGMLLVLDNRSVNDQLAESDVLKWGARVAVPLGEPVAGESNAPGRLQVSLYDTWYFHDTLEVGSGIPELDLLQGSPLLAPTGVFVSGGQSRHKLDWRTDLFKKGWSAQLTATWQSSTQVDGGGGAAPNPVLFSAFTILNLKFSADFDQLPDSRSNGWLKGTRVILVATNLFDTRQTVRDASGAIPSGFEPAYLNPLGRIVALYVRKLF